jgi:hypothetical protein
VARASYLTSAEGMTRWLEMVWTVGDAAEELELLKV